MRRVTRALTIWVKMPCQSANAKEGSKPDASKLALYKCLGCVQVNGLSYDVTNETFSEGKRRNIWLSCQSQMSQFEYIRGDLRTVL
jgi:hypothetical protein